MTAAAKILALRLPPTGYVLARAAEPYQEAYVTKDDGYSAEQLRALLDQAAAIAGQDDTARRLTEALAWALEFVPAAIRSVHRAERLEHTARRKAAIELIAAGLLEGA